MSELKKKVWLDDQAKDPEYKRKPADFYPGENNEDWAIFTDPRLAYNYIADHWKDITDISFDHDLQCFETDGREVTGASIARLLEEDCFNHEMNLRHVNMRCHSKNTASGGGRVGIEAAFANCLRFSERST